MTDTFRLQKEIERYTARITRGIRSRRRRAEVKAEYAAHIEDMMTEYAMRGMNEAEAFALAREQLGDETKIEELLRVVHNRDRLPSLIRVPLYVIAALGIASTYFWIDNRTFRAWYVFAVEVALLLIGIFGVYWACRLVKCMCIRTRAYRKLRAYAKGNGYKLTKNRSIYASLFKRGTAQALGRRLLWRYAHLVRLRLPIVSRGNTAEREIGMRKETARAVSFPLCYLCRPFSWSFFGEMPYSCLNFSEK